MAVARVRGRMQKTEVALLVVIGVVAGWLVLDLSPATRSHESGSITIPLSEAIEEPADVPGTALAQVRLEPDTVLAQIALWAMLSEETAQPQNESGDRDDDRSRPPGGSGDSTPVNADGPAQPEPEPEPAPTSSSSSSGGSSEGSTTGDGTGGPGGSTSGSSGGDAGGGGVVGPGGGGSGSGGGGGGYGGGGGGGGS